MGRDIGGREVKGRDECRGGEMGSLGGNGGEEVMMLEGKWQLGVENWRQRRKMGAGGGTETNWH